MISADVYSTRGVREPLHISSLQTCDPDGTGPSAPTYTSVRKPKPCEIEECRNWRFWKSPYAASEMPNIALQQP